MKKSKIHALLVAFAMITLMFSFSGASAATDANAISTVFVSSTGSDMFGDGKIDNPYGTLHRAFISLPYGGTVVVSGRINISEIETLPECKGIVTITSVYGGVDYRVSGGGRAVVNMENRIEISSPVIIKNIDLNAIASNQLIVCQGNYTCFGEGIVTTHSGKATNNIGITAGGNDKCNRDGAYVEINSGDWYRFRGANRGAGLVNGDTYIKVNGGTFSSMFEGGGAGDGSGDINILINGGTVAGGFYGTGGAPVTGNVNVVIAGGSMSSMMRATSGGAIDGDANFYLLGGTYGNKIYKGNSTVDGSMTLKYKDGLSIPTVEDFAKSSVSEADAAKILSDMNAKFDKAKAKFLGDSEQTLEEFLARIYVTESQGGASEVGGASDIESSVTLENRNYISGRNVTLGVTIKNSSSKSVSGIKIESGSERVVIAPLTDISVGGGETKEINITARALQKGDMTGDGRISVADAIAVLNAVSANGEPTYASDFNSDGKLDMSDAVDMLEKIAKVKGLQAERIISADELKAAVKVSVGEPAQTEASPYKNYGGAPVYAGGVLSGTQNSYAFADAGMQSYKLSGKISVPKDGFAGIFFSSETKNGIPSLDGYYVELDAKQETILFNSVNGGRYIEYGERKIPFEADTWYDFEILKDGEFTEVYFNNNKLDTDPYPKFNFEEAGKGTKYGFFMSNSDAKFKDISVSAYSRGINLEATYSNPIFPDMTDPEVYFENGIYYIYGAMSERGVNAGVYCYTTTDFKTFNDEGLCLKKGDAYGDKIFKAANIVKYGETYYLFYMTYVNSLSTSFTAYATSSSPKGPFTGDTTKALTKYGDFIGGQPFIDEDGQAYITYVRTTGGNILWAAKLILSGNTAEVDFTSAKLVLEPTEEWENAKAGVVECGYIVKHGGYYYMLYAGGNYNSTYGMGYATATSPLGPYKKYEYNPVFKGTEKMFGVGAVTIFTDGTGQHYMMYLKSNSSTVTRPLSSGIDKIKFVPNPAGGADIIEPYGPTATPMPLPTVKPIQNYQPSRFIW